MPPDRDLVRRLCRWMLKVSHERASHELLPSPRLMTVRIDEPLEMPLRDAQLRRRSHVGRRRLRLGSEISAKLSCADQRRNEDARARRHECELVPHLGDPPGSTSPRDCAAVEDDWLSVVRRQICCRVSKGRCRRCGSLKPRELSEPEPPTARTPFSPHETTAGLTDREGSWHYRSVSPLWEPLSARLFLVAGGAGGGSASASATSATSDNTIQCDAGTISRADVHVRPARHAGRPTREAR